MASRFKIAGTHNWNNTAAWDATSSGGAGGASFPVAGDAVTLDATSGNLVINVASACDGLFLNPYANTLSGTGSLTVTNSASFITGTVTWSGTLIAAPTDVFAGNLAMASGVTLDSFEINAAADVNRYSVSGSTRFNNNVTLTRGELRMQGTSAPMTCAKFISSNTNVRRLNTGSVVTVTGTGTVWDCATSTNLTISGFTGSIVVSNTGATGKTFAGGGLTYAAAVTISGSTGAVTFTGNNTLNSTFTSGATPLVFTGTTTTFGGTVTLTGCTAITGGNWVKTSGTVTAPHGCTITNNTASGGATFDATAAINGGGNSGWDFGEANNSLILGINF